MVTNHLARHNECPRMEFRIKVKYITASGPAEPARLIYTQSRPGQNLRMRSCLVSLTVAESSRKLINNANSSTSGSRNLTRAPPDSMLSGRFLLSSKSPIKMKAQARGGKDKAKRQKISVACDDCRARKVRCDGAQPSVCRDKALGR